MGTHAVAWKTLDTYDNENSFEDALDSIMDTVLKEEPEEMKEEQF